MSHVIDSEIVKDWKVNYLDPKQTNPRKIPDSKRPYMVLAYCEENNIRFEYRKRGVLFSIDYSPKEMKITSFDWLMFYPTNAEGTEFGCEVEPVKGRMAEDPFVQAVKYHIMAIAKRMSQMVDFIPE